jgi:hypothetical protein
MKRFWKDFEKYCTVLKDKIYEIEEGNKYITNE